MVFTPVFAVFKLLRVGGFFECLTDGFTVNRFYPESLGELAPDIVWNCCNFCGCINLSLSCSGVGFSSPISSRYILLENSPPIASARLIAEERMPVGVYRWVLEVAYVVLLLRRGRFGRRLTYVESFALTTVLRPE